MKKEVKIIEGNISVQAALSEQLLTKYTSKGTVLCSTLFSTTDTAIDKNILECIFKKVVIIVHEDIVTYNVSRPKRKSLLAFRFCLKKRTVNQQIAYFCIGKPQRVSKGKGIHYEKRRIKLSETTKESRLNSDWNLFCRYLKQYVEINGTYGFIMPGFDMKKAENDVFLKSLARVFPNTFIVAERNPALKSKYYMLRLEINEN